jgi:probable HAF family extracellular repeat protein
VQRCKGEHLGAVQPGTNSYPAAINDRGQVTGEVSGSGWALHAALWKAGTWTDLGTLGSAEAAGAGRAVNERGVVAGWSQSEVKNGTCGSATGRRVSPQPIPSPV